MKEKCKSRIENNQPVSTGFPRFAANSHVALVRGKSDDKTTKGVLTSLKKA
jgi:hypothetical protein